MAGEKPSGNQPPHAGGGNAGGNAGGGNANKGPSKNNNRRRSLRSKRRGRKPEEGSGEARDTREVREPRSESRPHAVTPKAADKNVRENRERRRRRRMRARQRGPNETAAPVVEDVLKDLPPLVPAFVYTHVLRPAMRDSFEFRTEHFSKVTRRLEDFHIDLSPLYPDGGDEIKGVAYIAPADRIEFTDDDEEEGIDDPDWDAAESGDAARLDGGRLDGGRLDGADDELAGELASDVADDIAISDDFYAELNDSVVDEYPDEDVDA
jgi:hypothetical protein